MYNEFLYISVWLRRFRIRIQTRCCLLGTATRGQHELEVNIRLTCSQRCNMCFEVFEFALICTSGVAVVAGNRDLGFAMNAAQPH